MQAKISFVDENGESVEFYVIDETRINEVNYLLVSEVDIENDDSQDVEVYIMREDKKDETGIADYTFVEDDEELQAVSKLFEQQLDDVDIEM